MSTCRTQSENGSPIGVTIATENYRSRAEVAADQFSKWTGCHAVILGESEVADAARLAAKYCAKPPAPHHVPYLAKLFLFDLVDRESVIFFDADWLCMRPWDTKGVADTGRLHAVRDFWWNAGVCRDCEVWGMRVEDYFGAGFMVLRRDNHLEWLRAAAALYGSADAILPEQALLNRAAQTLSLPVGYLPRDYNLTEAPSSDELGAFDIVGAHMMGGFPADRYRDFIATYENRGAPSLAPASAGMEGLWTYSRVGLDSRPLEFRPDGTIGAGTAGCERYWRVWQEYGRPVLGVFGIAGGERRMTLTLRAGREGAEWRGRWLRFERSEVLLTPLETTRASRIHQGQ